MTRIFVCEKREDVYADAWNCPFCKKSNLSIRSEDMGGGYSRYFVYCTNCGATGPKTGCREANLKEQAVQLWNQWRDK